MTRTVIDVKNNDMHLFGEYFQEDKENQIDVPCDYHWKINLNKLFLPWTCERLIWIAFLKHDPKKQDENNKSGTENKQQGQFCMFEDMAKDLVELILSFLR